MYMAQPRQILVAETGSQAPLPNVSMERHDCLKVYCTSICCVHLI